MSGQNHNPSVDPLSFNQCVVYCCTFLNDFIFVHVSDKKRYLALISITQGKLIFFLVIKPTEENYIYFLCDALLFTNQFMDPCQMKLCFRTYAKCADSDHLAHAHRFIRVFHSGSFQQNSLIL